MLEHAARIGKKILISGGGRCNFTNLHTTPGNFLSANPHFATSKTEGQLRIGKKTAPTGVELAVLQVSPASK